MRDKEYDRFGPWILEITDDDPVPPIFLPHVDAGVTPLLTFKIPRPIERRRARPGMHLYDYLVSLFDSGVEILRRHEDTVAAHRFAYDDIKALRVTDDLLRGTVDMVLTGETFSFPYNTVSEEIIARMASLVRERFRKGVSKAHDVVEAVVEPQLLGNHFYRIFMTERRREPEHLLMAAQGEERVAADDSFFRRFWYGILNKRLFESMHFSNGRELKIVGRGGVYRFRWQANYGVERLYLPLDSIRNADVAVDPAQPNVKLLSLVVGDARQQYGAMVDNATLDPYVSFLRSATAQ